MSGFKKVFYLKIILVIISIICLFNGTVYPFIFKENALRPPIGESDDTLSRAEENIKEITPLSSILFEGELPVEDIGFSEELLSERQISEWTKKGSMYLTFYRGLESQDHSRLKEEGFTKIPEEALIERQKRAQGTVNYLDDLVIHKGRLAFSGSTDACMFYHYSSDSRIIQIHIPIDLIIEDKSILILPEDTISYFNLFIPSSASLSSIYLYSSEIKACEIYLEKISEIIKSELKRKVEGGELSDIKDIISSCAEIIIPVEVANQFLRETKEIAVRRRHFYDLNLDRRTTAIIYSEDLIGSINNLIKLYGKEWTKSSPEKYIKYEDDVYHMQVIVNSGDESIIGFINNKREDKILSINKIGENRTRRAIGGSIRIYEDKEYKEHLIERYKETFALREGPIITEKKPYIIRNTVDSIWRTCLEIQEHYRSIRKNGETIFSKLGLDSKPTEKGMPMIRRALMNRHGQGYYKKNNSI